jgi:integrase
VVRPETLAKDGIFRLGPLFRSRTMPRLSNDQLPAYRLHKQSGQAIVTLSGKDFTLGCYGSAESRQKYQRLTAEWQANGRNIPVAKDDLIVLELISRFWKHAQTHYRKPDGTHTSELKNYKCALRPLKRLYGSTRVSDFTPRCLKTVLAEMVTMGWARTRINRELNRLRHVFMWGVGEDLIHPSIHHGLTAVDGLKRGRCEAHETAPVKPVTAEVVAATLAHLTPTVRAMVELQHLTAMRPGEACGMRGCDIETTGADGVWLYRPATHKTQHHGHSRIIPLGPQAQAVIRPFINPENPQAFLFSPARADAERRAARAAARKTPRSCGNTAGTNRRLKPKRIPGQSYSVEAYNHAIYYACDKAFPPPAPLGKLDGETIVQWIARLTAGQRAELSTWQKAHRWHPHQLRHAAATRMRERYGLEDTQALLGHKSLASTQVYAERKDGAAVRIMTIAG